MRILLVSDETGSPENTGFRIRLANTARCLASIGTLDWLILPRDAATIPESPADVPCVVHTERLALRPRVPSVLRWLTHADPWRIATVDREANLRGVELPSEAFDMVWFSHLDLYRALGPSLAARAKFVVLDFDNLESARIVHELAAEEQRAGALRRLVLRFDRQNWRRAERRSAGQVDLGYVCSELDRTRLDRPVQVFPNGANYPDPSYKRSPYPSPVLLFVGSLSYAPNADAVEHFANNVFPLVQQAIPDARFQVVGRQPPERISRLGTRRGIEVLGEVADTSAHLADAAVAVVPIRYGGGTRIKILEAFAHELPVVSTSVGCEGIDANHGEHLLVADDEKAFAQACISLVNSPDVAAELALHAGQLFEREYRWAHIRANVAEQVLRTFNEKTDAGGSRRRSTPIAQR